MDAATMERRHAAIERLQAVAGQMHEVTRRMGENIREPSLALGKLAIASRTAWACSQYALAHAEAGLMPEQLVDMIADQHPGGSSPGLQRLRLTTLESANRRLRRAPWPGQAVPA
ncbi:hypothetical protein [Bosea sp. ASV33]|uniref:hypothetical protein n=1 Tax=Bosea sp. ASV33 TaxID=2795106 RepID=UPI0018ECD73A|nr:hypothetical protein [Bosea sp. ASV33]